MLVMAAFFVCCRKASSPVAKPMTDSLTFVPDVHSAARPQQARVKHLALNLGVDFDKQQLAGQVVLHIETSADADSLWLDTKHLTIDRAELDNGQATTFHLHPAADPLGAPLAVAIKPGTKTVTIHYHTNPESEALQWLAPGQTAGKQHPFLFTQGEAILTRSWIPLQDSPGIKVTYEATITVPAGMMAVMSAENPRATSQDGKYSFKMPQPVAPYLIALAVGKLEFAPIGDRTGVYAEPVTLKAAQHEFADMENMLVAAEKLYGDYDWGRYDLLVLPPSFPFGGMENPRLTFATPTIIAGDRSLTTLVAHELAHSWSGNLVTNATWGDFWLNEGFTVYFERRIMEALYGKDYADMLAVLGHEELQQTVNDIGRDSKDTQLKLDLTGRNPDDGMNDIAYEKGYFFLRHVEDAVGRARFDQFLKDYFKSNAFKTMTTERFVQILKDSLLTPHDRGHKVQVDEWIYKPGLPASLPVPHSARFEAIEAQAAQLLQTKDVLKLHTEGWSAHEWVHFLRQLTGKAKADMLMSLDRRFKLTDSPNSEIKFAWLMLAVEANYKQAWPAMDQFLIHTGRRKFLTPLYKALLATPEGKAHARAVYVQARPNYHFVARNTMDALLEFKI